MSSLSPGRSGRILGRESTSPPAKVPITRRIATHANSSPPPPTRPPDPLRDGLTRMRKRGILAGGTESNSQHSTTRSPASTPPVSDGAIESVGGQRSRDPPSRRDHNATIAIMCAPLHEVTAPGAKRPCRAQPYRLEPRTRSCRGIMAGLPSRCTLALRQKRRTGAALGGTDLLAVAGRRIRGAS
jgi:hypothetical protein